MKNSSKGLKNITSIYIQEKSFYSSSDAELKIYVR